ncbi:MAG: substrate-binding domain-containing protein [Lachnospiraceae bacterium]|nr:substrate-binding domain-containing protein [Lachnospiraceae bacterium]
MKKRLVATMMSLAMTLALLAGCTAGGDSAGGNATSAAQQDGSGETAAPAQGSGQSAYGNVTANGEYSFVVIVKSMSSDFWRAAVQGAEDEAEVLGVKVNCQGPSSNTDIADQVQMLNNAINSAPDGIALAASDADAVMDALQAAKDAGIPVVCFNSGVPGAPDGSVLATAKTDNYNAGAIAAENMYEALKDQIAAASSDAQVRIGLVNQDVTSDSVVNRGLGFIDKMCELIRADGKTVGVTGSDKYVDDAKDAGDAATADVIIEVRVPAQATSELCATEASALLNEEDLIGIMGTNQETAEGIVTADENLGKLGNGVIGAGFDSGATVVGAVESGKLFGAVTQSPRFQGQIAVDLLTMIANGETVQDEETPAFWYNADNMNDPEIAPNLIR